MFHLVQAFYLSALTIFSVSIEFKLPFKLDEPTLKIELSEELKEISGLSWYKNSLAGVQDELGTVYLIEPGSGEILNRIRFSFPGDFEGVETVGNQFYALTSSGIIFSFDIKNPAEVERIQTPLSWKNDAEGLAYDDINNRLLILCKEQGSLTNSKSSSKSIFAYSLIFNKFEPKPLITLSLNDLQKFKELKKYKPSALAIDPMTCDIYILSSVGKAVVILDPNFKIIKVKKLSGKLFNQPEGICFSPQGDLYISNEGSSKEKANFYLFKRKDND